MFLLCLNHLFPICVKSNLESLAISIKFIAQYREHKGVMRLHWHFSTRFLLSGSWAAVDQMVFGPYRTSSRRELWWKQCPWRAPWCRWKQIRSKNCSSSCLIRCRPSSKGICHLCKIPLTPSLISLNSNISIHLSLCQGSRWTERANIILKIALRIQNSQSIKIGMKYFMKSKIFYCS